MELNSELDEIRLLIESGGKLHPIEVKKSGAPARDAIKHFKILEKLDLPIGEGALVCVAETHLPLTEKVTAVPAFCL